MYPVCVTTWFPAEMSKYADSVDVNVPKFVNIIKIEIFYINLRLMFLLDISS